MKASEKLKMLASKMDNEIERLARQGSFDFILKVIPDLIRIRTRLSKGVAKFNSGSSKIKAIAESTKKTRKRYKRNLLNETTPTRSNATGTGQMLNSITGTRSGTVFSFSFKGKRTKELNGSQSTLTNEQVAKYYQDNGRPFFNLSKTEVNNVTRQLREIINNRVKDIFSRL